VGRREGSRNLGWTQEFDDVPRCAAVAFGRSMNMEFAEVPGEPFEFDPDLELVGLRIVLKVALPRGGTVRRTIRFRTILDLRLIDWKVPYPDFRRRVSGYKNAE
jgi:hypothetical protein